MLVRSKLTVSVRERGGRDEGLRHRIRTKADEGSAILTLFLNTLWVYIQGLTSLLLWRGGLSQRPLALPPPLSLTHNTSEHLLTALRICLTDSLLAERLFMGICVHIIFITPMHSFRFSFRLLTHVIFLHNPLVYIAGTSCLESGVSVKGQYATKYCTICESP